MTPGGTGGTVGTDASGGINTPCGADEGAGKGELLVVVGPGIGVGVGSDDVGAGVVLVVVTVDVLPEALGPLYCQVIVGVDVLVELEPSGFFVVVVVEGSTVLTGPERTGPRPASGGVPFLPSALASGGASSG
jgi:hypothetical protein